MNLISTTDALKNFCQTLEKHPFITVDLEFLREHSYYAKLCLIQVGSQEECAIIDPLAEDLDLSPFFTILQNPNITKVFHSGRQDIEILFLLSGKIPTPVFDSQVAAMVLGFGESISYENLVRHILHIDLDKSSRLTDWSHRPLTEAQLNYALSDVTHLVPIYQELQKRLKKLNRNHWVDEEMKTLCSPQTYEINPDEIWMRIRHRSHNPRFLTILRELAAWRERRSQLRNTPRQSYIKDEMLLQIASVCPLTSEQLSGIRNLRKDISCGKLGQEIIEVLNHFMTIPESEYVTPPKEKPLPSKKTALWEVMKLLLKLKSNQEGVVARLITDDEELLNFCSGHGKNFSFLKGWRYEIFGQDALSLKNGELLISYNPTKHCIEFEKKTVTPSEENNTL